MLIDISHIMHQKYFLSVSLHLTIHILDCILSISTQFHTWTFYKTKHDCAVAKVQFEATCEAACDRHRLSEPEEPYTTVCIRLGSNLMVWLRMQVPHAVLTKKLLCLLALITLFHISGSCFAPICVCIFSQCYCCQILGGSVHHFDYKHAFYSVCVLYIHIRFIFPSPFCQL